MVLRSPTTWFGADDPWERPTDGHWLPDVVITACFLGLSSIELLLKHLVNPLSKPLWVVLAAGAGFYLPLVLRKRFPLITALVVVVWLYVVSYIAPEHATLASAQVATFFGVFSGVAWAKDRRATLAAMATVFLILAGWATWAFALSDAMEEQLRQLKVDVVRQTVISPMLAWFLFFMLINVVYFGGAAATGQMAWRQARDRQQLREQTATIAQQEKELRSQAIAEERLRIARELHDVAAQQVAATGVQAAAARRLLASNPTAAAEALGNVEQLTRNAVTEMRALLGTLRGATVGDESRSTDPTCFDIAKLAADLSDGRFTVVFAQSGEDEHKVPPAVSTALYRIAQEALTNVRKHSTASSVSVVLRLDPGSAEVEIVDDGRARQGTSGTAMGQLGMRERAAALGGVCEIGPRVTGGYRVRVRFPLAKDRS